MGGSLCFVCEQTEQGNFGRKFQPNEATQARKRFMRRVGGVRQANDNWHSRPNPARAQPPRADPAQRVSRVPEPAYTPTKCISPGCETHIAQGRVRCFKCMSKPLTGHARRRRLNEEGAFEEARF